jgi:hypothetical protein
MKVRELLESLEGVNPEAEVYIYDPEYEIDDEYYLDVRSAYWEPEVGFQGVFVIQKET